MSRKKDNAQFKTLALAEKNSRDKKTKVSEVSDENVKEAKDWVDFKEE